MSYSQKEQGDRPPESSQDDYEAGFAAGVEAEHARILSVHKVSLEGHEALTERMMLDGRTACVPVASRLVEQGSNPSEGQPNKKGPRCGPFVFGTP